MAKTISMQELHRAATERKALKPVQEAIMSFFKVDSWDEIREEFMEVVDAEKLLRFAVSIYMQSHGNSWKIKMLNFIC